VELAEQGDAGIVDEDVEAGMGGDRVSREFRDLRGIADIDAMDRSLAGMAAIDLGSDISQPRAASSSASARPIPLAAPVKAAAAPRIAVIRCRSMSAGRVLGPPRTLTCAPAMATAPAALPPHPAS
jgi:hypothetical protein